uniref:AAA_12 domain-containing protein n=1 Tax=Caenorhabditis japonica TaxID=281687 RepID=A0A8R1E8D9_CAEJA
MKNSQQENHHQDDRQEVIQDEFSRFRSLYGFGYQDSEKVPTSCLASLNVSPNQILLLNGIEPLKLTEVYRCHPAATKILSKIFYSGRLSSGRLIEEFEFLPSEIAVITPYTAQRDLLESYVLEVVRCTTNRKFQGAEFPIVLFSATHDGSKSKIWDDEDGVNNVHFRVGSKGATSFVNLIDNDSVILV